MVECDTCSAVGMAGADALAGFDDELTSADEVDIGQTDQPAFLTDKENAEMVAKAKEIAGACDGPDFKIYMAGSPVVTHTVKQLMMKPGARPTTSG